MELIVTPRRKKRPGPLVDLLIILAVTLWIWVILKMVLTRCPHPSCPDRFVMPKSAGVSFCRFGHNFQEAIKNLIDADLEEAELEETDRESR